MNNILEMLILSNNACLTVPQQAKYQKIFLLEDLHLALSHNNNRK